jgi:16S rRNA (guanine(1405)-N(7))-methyltransferase
VDNAQLEQLVDQVLSGSKYKHITPDLIHRLSQKALAEGLRGKTAVKSIRNKLHQVGGAYFKQAVNYSAAIQELQQLSPQIDATEIRDYAFRVMQRHTSSAERLPDIETFFQTCLAPIAPVTSINDLACGLNPLALPWMPVTDRVQYYACDIYLDMLELVEAFLMHCNVNHRVIPCDLITELPNVDTQVAFLLKSLPCLEQMDKLAAERLLTGILAEHILVSFPVHSLAGRKKGMPSFYKAHFQKLISGKPWTVQTFEFQTELAFLVSK